MDDLNMYDEEEIGFNPHEQHEDQEFSNDEPIEGGTALPHDNYSSQMLDCGAGESLMQSMGEENMMYEEEEEGEDYIEAGEQRINT